MNIAEAPIAPTSLARSTDTVDLDSNLPRIAAWTAVAGFGLFMLRRYFSANAVAARDDGLVELQHESRRIQARNQQRRAMKTA